MALLSATFSLVYHQQFLPKPYQCIVVHISQTGPPTPFARSCSTFGCTISPNMADSQGFSGRRKPFHTLRQWQGRRTLSLQPQKTK